MRTQDRVGIFYQIIGLGAGWSASALADNPTLSPWSLRNIDIAGWLMGLMAGAIVIRLAYLVWQDRR
jgi:hypothetical protein